MSLPITCTIFIGTSVDGFIARADGSLDFLPAEPEEHGYEAFMATVDAVVMGRHTYETVLGFGGAWPFRKPVVVLTGRPGGVALPEGADIALMAGEPRDIVARLAGRGLRHLYVDGGVTIQRFLDAGLIDRMVITRVPVLIGRGIPLFGPTSRDVHLQHVGTRTYPSGLVTSEYRVLKEPPA